MSPKQPKWLKIKDMEGLKGWSEQRKRHKAVRRKESGGHTELDLTRRDGSRRRQRGGYRMEGWMVGGGWKEAKHNQEQHDGEERKTREGGGEGRHDQKGFDEGKST